MYLRFCNSEGTWKIIAKLDHWPQNTFTAQFEVKKYGEFMSFYK